MTSIERTAYPRFKRVPSARELHVFYTPQPDEVAWARGVAGSGEHLLALLVLAKCFGRLGYFPALAEVPAVVVEHVRRDLGLAEGTAAVYASARTAKRHRDLVRQRLGVVRDPAGARKVAAEAIREAATRKNNPPDLINVALERLVEGCFELPGFSTLDEMASTIRGEVNAEIFAGIAGRAGPAGIGRLEALLEVPGPTAKSDFNRLKKTAPRPSWTNFRLQLDHLRWVDGIGDAPAWVAGIAASKLADFAGEAEVADAAVLRDYGGTKKAALLAAMVFTAQARARDDVAEMFCRRVATLTKRARKELEELKEQHRALTERLVANYRAVLERIDPDGPDGAQQLAALEMARKTVESAGGFAGQYADIDRVSAHHGDNHTPLVARHFRRDRAAMLAMAGALELQATSADRSVLDALDYVREFTALIRDHIPDRVPARDDDGRLLADAGGKPVMRELDVSFASEDWRRAIRDRQRPGMFVRRHLEACVLTYLAEELRTGDVAVAGAQAYANWAGQLLSPAECAALLPAFCAEVGLPASAAGFRAQLQARLTAQAAESDAGYPDNADLVIDEQGTAIAQEAAGRAAQPHGPCPGSGAGAADARAHAAGDPGPHRALAGVVAPLRPGVGIRPETGRPVLPLRADHVHLRHQHGPGAGRPAHRRGLRPRAGGHLPTARHHRQAEQAIADVVDAFMRAGPGPGVGRRGQRGRRRHADGHVHRQPARRDLDPVRRGRRDRLPPHLRHLHRLVLPVHPLRGVGGRLHHRRAAAAAGPSSSRPRCTPTRRASRSRCSPWLTCWGSS